MGLGGISMKKKLDDIRSPFILVLVGMVFFFLVSCDLGRVEIINHYESLKHLGKTVTISGFDYDTEVNDAIDYSDETRSLIDVSTLSDDDVINIPSASFEKAIREHLSLEGDITFGDVREIDYLMLTSREIKSIAGIEYFERLMTLILDDNPLASINGVQVLENLEVLSISGSYVNNIDYAFSKLRTLRANETFVKLNVEAFDRLVNHSPNLQKIAVENTPTRVDQTFVNRAEQLKDQRIVVMGVDYKQVDISSVGYDAFWEFNEEGLYWTNVMFDIKVKLSEDSDVLEGVIKSLYVDIKDENSADILSQAMFLWEVEIGVFEVEDNLERLILIYDYFIENIVISENGSEMIIGALNGEAVTLKTAYETLSFIFQQYQIEAYVREVTYEHFTENMSDRFILLKVNYDNQKYVLVFDEVITYEYFMIGQDNIVNLVTETFDVDKNLGLTIASMFTRYAQYDLLRETIEDAAEALNFELIYE